MHVRCPHCQNPIELVEEASLKEVVCPSCGSSFNLLGERTTATFSCSASRTLGHFNLIQQVGVGAFGSVWKARDNELDRTVAIKIPRKDQLDETEAQHFLREARTVAQLRHPSIVPIHEVGRQDSTLYIVSDFIEGATLSEWQTAQRLSPREAAALCVKIAEALHHAHEMGIVHRDLKPSNIMMDLDGQPHLMDFGLAKRDAGEITMTVEGRVLGTPAYMSPEQARGDAHQADRRSDVYSLGVLMFELLTHELPFRGSARMLVVQILKDEPPRPRTLNSSVSNDLETICLKCLEKEPLKRYQSAWDVAAELNRYLSGRPIMARRISRVARGWRWSKRNPLVSGLAASLAIALTIGLIVSTVQWIRADLASHSAAQSATEATFEATRANGLAVKEAAARKQAQEDTKRAIHHKEIADRSLSIAQINLIDQAWHQHQLSHMRDLLDQAANPTGAPPFEWSFWDARYKRLIPRTILAKSGLTCIAASPAGDVIASGAQDGSITLWNVTTGAQIATCSAHRTIVTHLAFAPNGKTLASVGIDTAVRLWDSTTLDLKSTLLGHTSFALCVAFSPDGASLATGARDSTIRVWDLVNGSSEVIITGLPRFSFFGVTYSPDGKTIAAGSDDDTVWLFDVTTRRVRQGTGHYNDVRRLAFSPDESLLASCSQDGTVILWDTKRFLALRRFDAHTGRVSSISFSRDGSELLSAGHDHAIKTWDARSGTLKQQWRGHADWVNDATYLPNSNIFVTCAEDRAIHFWDLSRHDEPDIHLRHDAAVSSVAITSDRKVVATGDEAGVIKLWRTTNGSLCQTLRAHNDIIQSLAFTLDGQVLLSGSKGSVKVWNASSGDLLQDAAVASLERLALSADGIKVVSVGQRGALGIWDPVQWAPADNPMRGNRALASSGVLAYPDALLAFSPDRTIIGVGGGQKDPPRSGLAIIDAVSGQVRNVVGGDWRGVESVTFAPSGHIIACGLTDGTIRLIDSKNGGTIRNIRGHTGGVRAVAFTPNGRTLATGSTDKTLRLWNAATGDPLTTMRFGSSVYALAFAPGGHFLVAGEDDGSVTLWRAAPETGNPSLPPLTATFGTALITRGSEWKYLADGEMPTSTWRDDTFDDSGWNQGRGELGYGDGDEATVIVSDYSLLANRVTFYFRKTFDVASAHSANDLLCLGLLADDGAIVYLNGTKVAVDNLSTEVAHHSRALRLRTGANESTVRYFNVDSTLLRKGKNVLAVELHQQTARSGDASFDLELWATTYSGLCRAVIHGDAQLQQQAASCLSQADTSSVDAFVALVEILSDNATPRPIQFTVLDKFFESCNVLKFDKESRAAVEQRGGEFGRAWVMAADLFETDVRLPGRDWSVAGNRPDDEYAMRVGLLMAERAARVVAEPTPGAARRKYALRLAEAADRVAPHDGRVSHVLGMVYYALGSRHQAFQAFDKCGDYCSKHNQTEPANNAAYRVAALIWLGDNSKANELLARIEDSVARLPPTERLVAKSAIAEARSTQWIVETLRDERAIRINCGGGERSKSSKGALWFDDRFFVSGTRAKDLFTGEIAGTDDDVPYRTERFFNITEAPNAGYRVPVPNGQYKVVLHFAEIFLTEGGRRFDIHLENDVVLRGYEPPWAKADQHGFTVEVADGWLDLGFGLVPGAGHSNPKVSAIEIIPLDVASRKDRPRAPEPDDT